MFKIEDLAKKRKWFRLDPERIADLNEFGQIWIAKRNEKFLVLGSNLNGDTDFCLGDFESEKDAIKYMDEIFQILIYN